MATICWITMGLPNCLGILVILKEIYWIRSSNLCLVFHLVFFNHYNMSFVNFLTYDTKTI